MPTGIITINVNTFVPNGCCVTDRPVISPGGGGQRVVYKSTDPTNPGYNTILLKSGKGNNGNGTKSNLDVQFVITPAGIYSADSVSFTQLLGGTSDPSGSTDFTGVTKSDNQITVTDVFANSDLTDSTQWSYTIGITRLAVPAVPGNPGTPAVPAASGTIDPGLENTDMD